jgi:uncharacterized membrane protein
MRHRVAWTAVVLWYVLLASATIHSLRPWVDEAWASAPAWMLVTHGYAGTPSMDGSAWNLLHLDRYTYWIPPLFIVLQGVWFKIVPFSLEMLRTLTALGGLGGVLLGAYCIQRLTGDRITGLLMGVLMAGEFNIVSASVMGRAEGLAFCFQLGAYACYLRWREQDLNRAILLGQTAVMLSGLTHPNAGILSFLGLACLICYFDLRRLKVMHVLIAMVPYGLGALAWGWYIAQDLPAFRAQYGFQTAMRFGLLSNPGRAIWQEIVRYVQVLGLGGHGPGVRGPVFLKAVPFLLYLTALIGLWISGRTRRQDAVRVLTAMLLAYLAFYTLLEATKATYYIIYILFLYTAFAAIWLRDLWVAGKVPRALIALGVAGILTIQAGAIFARARLDPYHHYYMNAVAYLQAHKLPGQLVIGSHELGFHLGFSKDFLDDFRMGTASNRKADYIVIEQFYEDRLEMMRLKMPEDHARVLALLANEYEEVYNRDFYRILTRKKPL